MMFGRLAVCAAGDYRRPGGKFSAAGARRTPSADGAGAAAAAAITTCPPSDRVADGWRYVLTCRPSRPTEIRETELRWVETWRVPTGLWNIEAANWATAATS